MAIRSSNLVEDTLHHLRDQLAVWVVISYLLYLTLYTLIMRPEFPTGFQDARYWGGLFALLIWVASRLKWLHRPRTAARMYALLFPLLVFQTQHLLRHQEPPTELLLWLMIVMVAFYITLGSRLGTVFTIGLLAAEMALVLVIRPVQPQLLAMWMAGGLVLVLLSAISQTLSRFIEGNLLMHEQSSYQLQAARLDALTGAYGRAALEELLNQAVGFAETNAAPLSIIVADIDHFKKVNDRYGHSMGDVVLRSFVRRLRRNVMSSGGVVGRWGGEEFVILLPNTSRPDARAMAERLRQVTAQAPIRGLEITASFGVASFRGERDDLDQLFSRADERLYEAKAAGRNTVR